MAPAKAETVAEPDIPTIVRLDIETLVAHPANRSIHDADIADLTNSMNTKIGLLQFPVVVPLPDGGHRIIVGHSRIRSAHQLGWSRIPCIVRDDLSSADELIALLGGNDRHRHFKPSERARIDTELALFPEFNTAKAIAAATQRDAPVVAGSLALHRLGKSAQRAADDGQLSLDDAIALEELGKADRKAVDRILGKAVKGNDLRYIIADAQRKQRRDTIIATTTKQLSAEGVTVIKPPKGFPYTSKAAPLDNLETGQGNPIDANKVRTQKGYAAVVDVDWGLNPCITYVCIDPEATGHRRLGGRYTDPEEQRAQAERAARQAERREQLQTAATVRLKWLRQNLATQTKAKAWLDDALCHYWDSDLEFYPDDTPDALCAMAPAETKITAKRATHRFVAMVVGGLHDRACEPAHRGTAHALAQFYDLISTRGYTLTEVEQAERDECDRLLTPDDEVTPTDPAQQPHRDDEIDPDDDAEPNPAADTTVQQQEPATVGADQ